MGYKTMKWLRKTLITRKRYLCIASVFAISMCWNSSVANAHSDKDLRELSTISQRELVSALAPLFKKSKTGGRVYFEATCISPSKQRNAINLSEQMLFPSIDISVSSPLSLNSSSIKNIFHGKNKVSIYENNKGLISIHIGKVEDKILQTKVSEIHFDVMDQYNPGDAIVKVINNRDIRASAGRLGVRSLSPFSEFLEVMPDKNFVHLSPDMKNVTLDNALDNIASTFHGIVMYGSCRRQRLFHVYFVGGVYYDDGTPDNVGSSSSAAK